MPKSTLCKLERKTLTIEEAIKLRDATAKQGKPYLEFVCIECSEFVQPHGGGLVPHFEHRRDTHSPSCSLRSSR